MHEWPEDISAVEAVRCVFLARELRKLGQTEAAARWEARAAAWIRRKCTALESASTTATTPPAKEKPQTN